MLFASINLKALEILKKIIFPKAYFSIEKNFIISLKI